MCSKSGGAKLQKDIVVAITGATGVIYGIKLLEVLKGIDHVQTHLVISDWGLKVVELETDYRPDEVAALADFHHGFKELSAPIASGSFQADAMVIVPCSMKTLSAVAHGFADNLIARAADVMLKERRPLILVPRETPLNRIHLDNMTLIDKAGGVIMPATLDDIVLQFTARIADMLELPHQLTKRWGVSPEGGECDGGKIDF
jgi:4-hydroxy-3-polyprenylbenzoate decarboxylase